MEIEIPERDVENILTRLGIPIERKDDPTVQNFLILAVVLIGVVSGIDRALTPAGLLYMNMKQTDPAIRLNNLEVYHTEDADAKQRETLHQVQKLVYAALMILGKNSLDDTFASDAEKLVEFAREFANQYNTSKYTNLA